MPLTLYYHPLSSYCHKVLTALYENDTPFTGVIVNLGDAGERADLEARWPIGKFPVIHDANSDRNVAESSIIIEYLDRFFRGDTVLIPTDIDDALEVRLWDRIFDTYVHTPMQEIVADRIGGSQGDMAPRRQMIARAYGMIDRHMEGRDWINRSGFSLADCAAAPSLFYAHVLVPIGTGTPNLKAYFDRLVERPSYRRVLEEAKPFFQYFPFVENLDKRFLP